MPFTQVPHLEAAIGHQGFISLFSQWLLMATNTTELSGITPLVAGLTNVAVMVDHYQQGEVVNEALFRQYMDDLSQVVDYYAEGQTIQWSDTSPIKMVR